ncbi:hypothetical protein GCM10010517_56390 [Streptosporangium fragile]|uniref:SIR2-like domain-containing protein n=1 Tax=Streptosporangium fragile TaxID=46186 RepID=A0ABN3W4X3_9ACTN
MATYWGNRLPRPEGGACVVVEALHQDIRVIMRNLVVANAIRCVVPSHLVVVTGTDEQWSETLWQDFDVEHVRSLAGAFGASDVLNVHELAGSCGPSDVLTVHGLAGAAGVPGVFGALGPAGGHAGGAARLRPAGSGDAPARRPVPPIDPGLLRRFVDATMCRLNLVPRLPPAAAADPAYLARHARGAAFSAFYDALFDAVTPVAFVTSHVDYDQWGLAVESAMRRDVPVVHVQSTGSLKAYTLFPEKRTGQVSYRAELTRQIGDYFERAVWPNRDILRASAELVTWRAKGNLGRPSWWRAGAFAAAELRNEVERDQLRAHALRRLGFGPDRPVVTVFNHAVSDALGTNVEVFDDLARWFEETAEYAAADTAANWVFLDHPSQFRYDSTGFFEQVAERYAGHSHMVFRPSVAISKNMLWSLTDLGVTVRGSVSNELPAFGIPVIQAGWSEWSSCGLSFVAEDRPSYWRLLETSVEKAAKGQPILGEEQRERARLWLWFYRCATDVTSPLVPAWDTGAGNELLRTLFINMSHVESDGDPLFSSVVRMWERRDPFLTRFDLLSPDALASATFPLRSS